MQEQDYILIPLWRADGSIGAHVIVDLVDANLADHRWYQTGSGYAARGFNRKPLLFMHRAILGLVRGDGLEGDHINRDKLDNRRHNLRAVTRAQNQQNVAARPGGSSTYRGVCWDHVNRKWMVRVCVNGRVYNLGRFIDELEAAAVARAFRLTHMPFTNEECAA